MAESYAVPYGAAVWRPAAATVLAFLALFPSVAQATADQAGKFAFTPAPAHVVKTPPRPPGSAGELRTVRVKTSSERGLRVAVLVEGGLPVTTRGFARKITAALYDPRGWRRAGYAFRLVADEQADVEVVLASAELTDRLCAPLQTLAIYSCAQGNRAVLNFARWHGGAPAYRSLARYRIYMINHEVGHVLGRAHAYCSTPGAAAPVMVQQTKGVAPCRPNPWPLTGE
jgi:Protein of unknown function (DUF3152)